MSDLGCPFVAGPTCRDCDGSCWEPQRGPAAPEPCYTCSMIVGGATWCEGLCEGITTEAEFEAARAKFMGDQ